MCTGLSGDSFLSGRTSCRDFAVAIFVQLLMIFAVDNVSRFANFVVWVLSASLKEAKKPHRKVISGAYSQTGR